MTKEEQRVREQALLTDEEIDKRFVDSWAERNTEVDSPLALKTIDNDDSIDVLRELAQAQLDEALKNEGVLLKSDVQSLPENPYHPNPLREYDHQITDAGMIGYGEAQQDMLNPDSEGNHWVKVIPKENKE